MTAPPPPPPYPPHPPHWSPGDPPPYPRPPRVLAREAYTPWSTRLLASLIDWTPIWLIFVVPVLGMLVTGDTECIEFMYGDGGGDCATASSNIWLGVQFILFLAGPVYFFWNFCYRQGKTGQSVGKSAMKFKVISEKSWQPIGFWLSLVRQIAHYIDQLICYIGYLFPLWDDKRQTIADMLMRTICVPRNMQPPPPWYDVGSPDGADAGQCVNDNHLVHLRRAFVGQHRLEVGGVPNHRMLQGDSVCCASCRAR